MKDVAASTGTLPGVVQTPEPASRVRVAVVVLVFCCVCWGLSFPLMKLAIEAFEGHVRDGLGGDVPIHVKVALNATFNGWRFLIASLLYWAMTFSRQKSHTRDEWIGGTLIGVFFAIGMQAQIGGLRYTLPSISGFLTSLVVVFAPLAQAFVFKQRVRPLMWLAVAIAFAGIVVLSQPAPGADTVAPKPPPLPYLGEMLTVLGAVLFTAQLLALDRYGKSGDAARLTLLMFSITSVLSLLIGAVLGAREIYRADVLKGSLGDTTILWSLLCIIIFSSVVAMHLMNTWQPRVSPATAAVVYCAEPIFATFFSVLLGTENIGVATFVGGALILFAVLLVAGRTDNVAPQELQLSIGKQNPN